MFINQLEEVYRARKEVLVYRCSDQTRSSPRSSFSQLQFPKEFAGTPEKVKSEIKKLKIELGTISAI